MAANGKFNALFNRLGQLEDAFYPNNINYRLNETIVHINEVDDRERENVEQVQSSLMEIRNGLDFVASFEQKNDIRFQKLEKQLESLQKENNCYNIKVLSLEKQLTDLKKQNDMLLKDKVEQAIQAFKSSQDKDSYASKLILSERFKNLSKEIDEVNKNVGDRAEISRIMIEQLSRSVDSKLVKMKEEMNKSPQEDVNESLRKLKEDVESNFQVFLRKEESMEKFKEYIENNFKIVSGKNEKTEIRIERLETCNDNSKQMERICALEKEIGNLSNEFKLGKEFDNVFKSTTVVEFGQVRRLIEEKVNTKNLLEWIALKKGSEAKKDLKIQEQFESLKGNLIEKIEIIRKNTVAIDNKQEDKYSQLNKDILRIKNNIQAIQTDSQERQKINKDDRKAIKYNTKAINKIVEQSVFLKNEISSKFKNQKDEFNKEISVNYSKLTKHVDEKIKYFTSHSLNKQEFQEKVKQINRELMTVKEMKKECDQFKQTINNKISLIEKNCKEIDNKYSQLVQEVKEIKEDSCKNKEIEQKISCRLESLEIRLSPFNLFNSLNMQSKEYELKSRQILNILKQIIPKSNKLDLMDKINLKVESHLNFLKTFHKSCNLSSKTKIKPYVKKRKKTAIIPIKAEKEIAILYHRQVLKNTNKYVNNINFLSRIIGPRTYKNNHRKRNRLKV